jgi:hypothetical protein
MKAEIRAALFSAYGQRIRGPSCSDLRHWKRVGKTGPFGGNSRIRVSLLAGSAFLMTLPVQLAATECAFIAGNWTNTFDEYFNLSQSGTSQISGTAGPNQNPNNCPVYSVSGTMDAATGNFSLNATVTSNPPSAACAVYVQYWGHIDKPGCQVAPSNFVSSNSWTSWSGTTTLGRPCSIPSSESTSQGDWDSTQPTKFLWIATLQPTTFNYAGRVVGEDNPGGATDTCWFQGSNRDYQNDVTGTNGNVNLSNQYGDLVGWNADAITYYRGQNRAPCSMTTVQRIFIDCYSGTVTVQYNSLGLGFDATTVWSSRAGQTVSHPWP